MTNDMTKGNPLKIFIFFSIPLLIGNVFQQLYSMVDTIIVGRFVGVEALAAVGSTGSMFFLVNGMILGLTSGFGVLVAQKFGAKDEVAIKKAVASNIILTLVLTVFITIIALLVKNPLLRMMNTPDNIFNDASTYITIIFAGIITQALYNMAAGILRALGDSKTPLYFLMVSSIVNVISLPSIGSVYCDIVYGRSLFVLSSSAIFTPGVPDKISLYFNAIPVSPCPSILVDPKTCDKNSPFG